jgi:hypothetical protein
MNSNPANAKNPTDVAELPGYVDLNRLMSAPPREEKWIVEGLIAEQRLTALIGEAKIGKSLLALEVAAAVSNGLPVLGMPTVKTRTLYLDMENNVDSDVKPRLEQFGYREGDFDNFIYLSFPNLPMFDTPEGGETIARIVEAHNIKLVVIDTVSRVVSGDENSNDTWNRFYKNTELRLKQAKVAALRIDHVGKDGSKGARGGSAKSGDVDLVIRMTANRSGQIVLRRDAARMKGGFERLDLQREDLPRLHHAVIGAEVRRDPEAQAQVLVHRLDAEGVPRGLTNQATWDAIHDLGVKCSKGVSLQVTRIRKDIPSSIEHHQVDESTFSQPDPHEGGGPVWGWSIPSSSGMSPRKARQRRGCLN